MVRAPSRRLGREPPGRRASRSQSLLIMIHKFPSYLCVVSGSERWSPAETHAPLSSASLTMTGICVMGSMTSRSPLDYKKYYQGSNPPSSGKRSTSNAFAGFSFPALAFSMASCFSFAPALSPPAGTFGAPCLLCFSRRPEMVGIWARADQHE